MESSAASTAERPYCGSGRKVTVRHRDNGVLTPMGLGAALGPLRMAAPRCRGERVAAAHRLGPGTIATAWLSPPAAWRRPPAPSGPAWPPASSRCLRLQWAPPPAWDSEPTRVWPMGPPGAEARSTRSARIPAVLPDFDPGRGRTPRPLGKESAQRTPCVKKEKKRKEQEAKVDGKRRTSGDRLGGTPQGPLRGSMKLPTRTRSPLSSERFSSASLRRWRGARRW